jgi:hypothetical protein
VGSSEDKRKKGTKTSGSGGYSLMLNDTLRRESGKTRRSAHQAFEKARQVSDPPPIESEAPPSRAELAPPRAPMPTDPAAAGAEVKAATVALTTSVDQICEALVLVFGEMKGSTTTLAAVTRVLMLLMLGQMVAFGFMGYMVWRLESVVDQAESTRLEQARTTVEIAKLNKSSEATKRSVDEVKSAAKDAPKVEIVADENTPGSAVVRIVPPSKSTEPHPSASSPSVVIPLKLDEAREGPAGR